MCLRPRWTIMVLCEVRRNLPDLHDGKDDVRGLRMVAGIETAILIF
jgi:hypothetical protein